MNSVVNTKLLDDLVSVLAYKAQKLSTDYAIALSQKYVISSPVFSKLRETLGQDKHILLYFQVFIKYKITPQIFFLCEKMLHSRLQESSFDRVAFLNEPTILDKALFPKLKKAVYMPPHSSHAHEFFSKVVCPYIPNRSMRVKMGLKSILLRLYSQLNSMDPASICKDGGMIAVKLTEGFDINKRSDIFWIEDSGIDPSHVLFYFKELHRIRSYGIQKLMKEIERLGFRCVCLSPIIDRKVLVWYPRNGYGDGIIRFIVRSKDPMERWLEYVAQCLLRKVCYWAAFFREFDIKVLFIKGERQPETIIQKIAFSYNGNKSGLICGYQRSEMFYPPGLLPGYHPKDIVFSWGIQSKFYFMPNLDHVKTNIITGYPYKIGTMGTRDIGKDDNEYSTFLRAHNVRFIITLFDNMSGGLLNPLRPSMVKKFYTTFFTWMDEDDEIGLLIKSKSYHVLNGMEDIREHINQLVKAGRCYYIYEKGLLPMEIARYADLSVGIGISTAIIEAAIAGCRAVHLDLTKTYTHHYYQWGKNRVIFDSAEELLTMMKHYKVNPADSSKLGDWSEHIDDIDPFHDADGGKRIGMYVKSLFEQLRGGATQEEAIDYANMIYSQQWGKDKIIDLQ